MFSKNHALIVVDQQADFEPGGALAVSGGDEIAGPIADLMQNFHTIVVTQDSHPAGHISFASSHKNKKPFELLTIDEVVEEKVESKFSNDELLHYLKSIKNHSQVLWPDHCVMGTKGWKINSKIVLDRANLILRKGTRIDCDSYSAFFENDRTSTGLGEFLKAREIQRLTIVGLAGDYCVAWSALDARSLGFDVEMPLQLTRFVNFPTDSKILAIESLKNKGVLLT